MRGLTGELPYRGQILQGDDELSTIPPENLASRRGVLPQAVMLAFPFTVYELVRIGLATTSIGAEARVASALAAVGLPGFAGELYQELSGGEQQCVQLARVLVQVWQPVGPDGPRWLMLDEPVSSLDINADQQIDSTYIRGSSPIGDAAVAAIGYANHRYETTKLTAKNSANFSTGGFDHDLRTGFEVIRRTRAEANSAPGGKGCRFYAFANGFSVVASGAYTENLPILDDFDNPAYMTRLQKARTWELGAADDSDDLLGRGDNFAIKVALFQTDVWDVTSYTGVETIDMTGIEVEAAYAMASGFYVDLNATMSEGDATRATASEYWAQAPADRLRLILGQRVGQELDFSWETVASGRMDRVNARTPESAGYVVPNLRATYPPQSGALEGAELRVGIENVFDKDYQPWLATRNAPGRNLKLTLAKSF